MADETLYLYTSLTAGSSHIITATSRMETILKANRIPFRALDCATDEKARQLWSRRSKNKKLPGLVKYGQVVADLEQVEEWNEFGELIDQLDDVSDIFGDTPMTDTPMAAPVNTIPASLLKPIFESPARSSQAMSRSSSDGKHISIWEPTEKKVKVDNQPSKNISEQASLAMAMRDLGAEAAAKVGQLKSAVTKSAAAAGVIKPDDSANPTAAAVPVSKQIDPSETTPTPAHIRSSADAVLDSTSAEEKQSITAAKTPAQLEAEGVRKSSVEKVSPLAETASAADTSDVPPSAGTTSETRSTEEQVLDLRRTSSIAVAKSSLSQETNINDIPSEDEDGSSVEDEEEDTNTNHKTAAAQAVANVEREKAQAKVKGLSTPDNDEAGVDKIRARVPAGSTKVPEAPVVSTDDVTATAVERPSPKTHRGSSVEEAPADKIKEIEKKNTIEEEDEEEEDDEEDDDDSDGEKDDDETEEGTKVSAKSEQKPDTKKVGATDESEKKATKGIDPQDTKAAEPNDADKSIGD